MPSCLEEERKARPQHEMPAGTGEPRGGSRWPWLLWAGPRSPGPVSTAPGRPRSPRPVPGQLWLALQSWLDSQSWPVPAVPTAPHSPGPAPTAPAGPAQAAAWPRREGGGKAGGRGAEGRRGCRPGGWGAWNFRKISPAAPADNGEEWGGGSETWKV